MDTDTERRLRPGTQTHQSVTGPASAKATFGPVFICVHLCSSVVELNRSGLALAHPMTLRTWHPQSLVSLSVIAAGPEIDLLDVTSEFFD
jgi:hypothetical protein